MPPSNLGEVVFTLQLNKAAMAAEAPVTPRTPAFQFCRITASNSARFAICSASVAVSACI